MYSVENKVELQYSFVEKVAMWRIKSTLLVHRFRSIVSPTDPHKAVC